jgi:hypothetical protein
MMNCFYASLGKRKLETTFLLAKFEEMYSHMEKREFFFKKKVKLKKIASTLKKATGGRDFCQLSLGRLPMLLNFFYSRVGKPSFCNTNCHFILFFN